MMVFLRPLVHLHNGRGGIGSGFTETLHESIEVEVLSDEHHLRYAFLIVSPWNIRWSEVNLLVDALEEILVIPLVAEGEETLSAE